MHDVTVCVLLYGDYPELAQRCLGSLQVLPSGTPVRIGLNATSDATGAVVHDFMLTGRFNTIIWTVDHGANIHKYPMMRRMFYETPIETEFVMWFDDDSFIKPNAGPDWLDGVRRAMKSHVAMLGAEYRIPAIGNQIAWVKDQPWYNGVPFPSVRPFFTFATGGWWVIRTEVLRKFDWPPTCLDHRGGDVMLGELLRQQGLVRLDYRQGVAINADEFGRESKAPRRGYGVDKSVKPIGWDYVPK